MIKKIFDIRKIQTDTNDVATIEVGGVVGLLVNEVSFLVEGNWKPLFDSLGILDGLDTAMSLTAGRTLVSSGKFTKKIYKGGAGYLKLSPDMRIIDWEGTPLTNVITKVQTLIRFTAPQGRDISDSGISDEGVFSGLKDKLSNAFVGIGEQAPKTVFVRMSNYLSTKKMGPWAGQMVIDSMSVTFSKEHTPAGPLYADINFQLSSLFANNSRELSGLISGTSKQKATTK